MTRYALLVAVALSSLSGVGQEPEPKLQEVAQGPVKPLPVQLKDEARKNRKTGLKPTPRHVIAAAKRHRPTIGAPAYYFRFPKKLSVWGNDQYGVCVTTESSYNRACSGIYITEDEVIRWARQNGVLNGAMLDQVIDMQQSKGFSQDGNIYGNGGGSVVNYADSAFMKAAVYAAGVDKGCLSIGISSSMLPSGAGDEHGWFLSGPTNDRDEDHCVPISGFGTAQQFVTALNAAYGTSVTVPANMPRETFGYAMFTWGTVGFVEASSFVGMTGEVWIRNPSTIIHGTGVPTPDEVYVSTDTPGPGPGPIPPGPTPMPGETPIVTFSQDMKAGSYEQWPPGSRAKAVEAGKTMAELLQLLSPTLPPVPVGTLEKRVDSLESGVVNIQSSLKEIRDILKGGGK